jgi:hypothetical protein
LLARNFRRRALHLDMNARLNDGAVLGVPANFSKREQIHFAWRQ